MIMSTAGLFAKSTPVVPIRPIHLDLKGCPPTGRRLISLLRVWAAAGYNAVVVEWEDTFPWTVDERFRCETAYSPQTIRDFCAEAARLGIDVIPLVQCLGHMETPLQTPGYEKLREIPHKATTLNPLAPGARELITRMVEDVLALSPKLKYFHLGGDEAFGMGTHPDTKAFIEKHGQDGKAALYLQHVEPILDLLRARGIRPILWDDMMRHWDDVSLRRIAPKADLMVWAYGGDALQRHGQFMERFKQHGVSLWGAGCFKGAESPSADLPDIDDRAANTLTWVRAATQYNMKGVLATGWSRHQTQRPMSIFIDAALDAAVMCALILHDGELPKGGIETCLKVLETVGERDAFVQRRAVVTEMNQARMHAWDGVRSTREQLIVGMRDIRRRGGWAEMEALRDLRYCVAKSDEIKAKLFAAFDGLVDPIWLERYWAERFEPLWEEATTLELRVRQWDPAGYAASGWRTIANSEADERAGLGPTA